MVLDLNEIGIDPNRSIDQPEIPDTK